MGTTELDIRDQVVDFGSTFATFARKRSFMRRFYELWLLEHRIGCVRRSDDSDVAFASCNLGSGVEVRLRGWDVVGEVDISWSGDLDRGLQAKLAGLYVPDDQQPLLDSFSLSTDVVGSRYRKFTAGWMRGTHSMDKPDDSEAVKHVISLSAGQR
jgi:hypothetical protein